MQIWIVFSSNCICCFMSAAGDYIQEKLYKTLDCELVRKEAAQVFTHPDCKA